MNIQEMIGYFRDDTGVVEPEDLPDNSIIKLLNRAGIALIDLDSYAIERQYSQDAVANKYEYDLPSDFYDARLLIIDNDDRSRKTDVSEITNALANVSGSGEPYMHAFWKSKLLIYWPSGSSAVTTTLDGSITATSTSITLDAPSSGSLPARGCIEIDSEKIYFQKSTVSGSSVTLSNLTRGVEDTVAAAHSDAVTVTVQNIELQYYARYRKLLLAPETGRADLASGGSNLDAGRHYLMWTYYDNSRGLESYPHDLYSITSAASNKIALTNLVDAPDLESYQKRIYMTKAGYTQPFYLVTTLSSGTTSYNIDSADATIAANDSFSWSNCGGFNMPDELRLAQIEWAESIWLKRSKRYNEAQVLQDNAAAKFVKGATAIKRRRSVFARARRPDVYYR